MNMLRNQYFASCYASTVGAHGLVSVDPSDVASPINLDEMDALCPFDDTTGHRVQPLALAMRDSTSDSQRQALLSSLQKIESSEQFKGLSDDMKLKLCKLRDFQTSSELREYSAFVNRYLDYVESTSDSPSDTPSADTPSADAPSA